MDVPTKVLALDPGKTFGWAYFFEGKLVDAGHCSLAAFHKQELSGQAKRAHMKLPPVLNTGVVVGELPVHYRQGGERSKHAATPNDLIALGVTLGELFGWYRAQGMVLFEKMTAREWKGTVDKDLCHRRIEKSLSADEKFPTNHNARDAVGIGLWRVGRYLRGR